MVSHRSKAGTTFQEGDTISQSDARAELLAALTECGDFVNHNVTEPLKQGQFDALCDFIYNLGEGAFYHSTLLTMLNMGDYNGAYNQFPRWCHAGGKVVRDLYNRRLAEQELWKGTWNEQETNIPK